MPYDGDPFEPLDISWSQILNSGQFGHYHGRKRIII